jgi:hypothetical protein
MRAGINPAASIYWLRHAHASHAIDNGASITLVSGTLGHVDPKTAVRARQARRKQRPVFEDEDLASSPTRANGGFPTLDVLAPQSLQRD